MTDPLRPLLVTTVLAGALALAPHAAGQGAPDELPEDVSCIECHEDRVTGESIHMPAASDCTTCHEQVDATRHAFTLAMPAEELCGTCHEDTAKGTNVHFPVAEGACTSCHDAHASKHESLLKSGEQELCASCHDPLPGSDAEHVHGPVAMGMCGSCHDPHASTLDCLLLGDGTQLCLGCHGDLVPEGDGEVRWHLPAEQDCASCHAGHGSAVARLLLAPQPAICTGCHEVATTHAPTTQGQACAGCHDPHATRHDAFLRSDERELCLSCHDREIPRPDAAPIRDVGAELGGDATPHGPIGMGSCAACHDPHGSEEAGFLKGPYTTRFYAPIETAEYGLCFSCHDERLVTARQSTETGFRDGNRNLHFLHVSRKKGRTCRVCHTTHASRVEHQLRETVPFGKWMLPIGFQPGENGGTCASGCHVRVGYAR